MCRSAGCLFLSPWACWNTHVLRYYLMARSDLLSPTGGGCSDSIISNNVRLWMCASAPAARRARSLARFGSLLSLYCAELLSTRTPQPLLSSAALPPSCSLSPFLSALWVCGEWCMCLCACHSVVFAPSSLGSFSCLVKFSGAWQQTGDTHSLNGSTDFNDRDGPNGSIDSMKSKVSTFSGVGIAMCRCWC